MKSHIPLFVVFGLATLGLVAGCGSSDFGQVEGTVTMDGAPLQGATVEFQPIKGKRPSYGTTDESGHYTLSYTMEKSGAEVGEHQVRITKPLIKSDESGDDVILGEQVPAKYNVNTELKKTVEAGSNTFDFALDSQGQKVQPGTGAGGGRRPPPVVCGGWEEDEY
jgi:hypothetical protein